MCNSLKTRTNKFGKMYMTSFLLNANKHFILNENNLIAEVKGKLAAINEFSPLLWHERK